MTPDLVYDQLIGAGCASKLQFSWGGNPGVGSLHRMRDAVENVIGRVRWRSRSTRTRAWRRRMRRARARNSCAPSVLVCSGRYVGSDLPKYNPRIKFVECPFTGERLAAIPAIRPDVTVIHAQKADRRGNVLMWGVVGVQKEAVMGAKHSIVTVEEIVDKLDAPPNSVVLPTWVVRAVCQVKGGAFPSYAQGYYPRNNAFYKRWDQISRERESFAAWIERHVLGTKDFEEFRRSLEEETAHG